MIAKWRARALTVTAALVLSYLSVGSNVGARPTESGTGPCDKQCGSGTGVNCDEGDHKTWDSAYDRDANGSLHSNCADGPCSTYHGCTGDQLNPIDVLNSAVESGNALALAKLLSTNDKVTVNRERAAFQVASCSGSIVAHFPAAEHLIAAVATESSRQ